MYHNRALMKKDVRQQLKRDPSLLKVTVIMMLLTVVLDGVLSVFYSIPLDNLYTALETAALAEDQAGMMTAIGSFFTSTSGMVSIFFTIFMTLYRVVVDFGLIRASLAYRRGEEAQAGELASGIPYIFRIILLYVLQMLLIYLWSMLFVFPGLIAFYRYRMAMYCMADDPELTPLQALGRSKELMNGRKAELFTLDLSFIGWVVGLMAVSYGESALADLLQSGLEHILPSIAAQLLAEIFYLIVLVAVMFYFQAYYQASVSSFYLGITGQDGGMAETEYGV